MGLGRASGEKVQEPWNRRMLPFKNFGKSLSSTWCVSLTTTQLSFSGPGQGEEPEAPRCPKPNRLLPLSTLLWSAAA